MIPEQKNRNKVKKMKTVRKEKTQSKAIAATSKHPMKIILAAQFLIISGAWSMSGLLQVLVTV